MSFAVKKITPFYLLVICLYFIFPFSYDIDQIRQFLCTSIVVFGLSKLYFSTSNLKPIIKYLILVAIASLFHQSALFFVLFALSKIKNKKFFISLLLISIFAFLVVFAFGVDFVGRVAGLLGISKVVGYVDNKYSGYSMNPLLAIFELLMTIGFVWISWRCYFLSGRKNKYEFVWKIACLSSLVLPALTFSLMFERLLRPMILLIYCSFSSFFILEKRKERWLVLIALMVIIALRLSFSFEYITKMFENFTFTGV